MGRPSAWVMLIVTLAASAALGYGAYKLADYSWNAVVQYKSLYVTPQLAPTSPQAPMAKRTVFVIIDGLRLDASRQMNSLRALRLHGYDVSTTVPQPSLSYPNWTTLLSGAPPFMGGVVTNWHEGRAPVETLFDTARRAGVRTIFAGPRDFDTLYGVSEKADRSYLLKWDKRYLSGRYVDAALALSKEESAGLVIVHLPDIDEAGHASGGESAEYANVVAKVDNDLGRLIDGLQSESTVFIVSADHGHIGSGGHGGWEPEVTRVPLIFAGSAITLGRGTAKLEDVASSVALIAGIPIPRDSVGIPVTEVGIGIDAASTAAESRAIAVERRLRVVDAASVTPIGNSEFGAGASGMDGLVVMAEKERSEQERASRLGYLFGGIAALLIVGLLAGIASWRALVAAVCGSAFYYAVYNGLFFLVHRYRWSLSAFNSEDRIEQWMNMRLVEAALAAAVAAAVAGLVYPLLRRSPKGPQHGYLAGWLTLGPLTSLVILLTLGVQVGWFAWWWGINPVWRLPDLMWGFKYDLDLIQATAVGFAGVVTPLVTYVIGRYHPKVRASTVEE